MEQFWLKIETDFEISFLIVHRSKEKNQAMLWMKGGKDDDNRRKVNSCEE